MPKVSVKYAKLRREEVVAGARTAFARNGYRGTTVADLEDCTGLTRGTIFRYFSSKADILAEVLASEEEALRRGYEESLAMESLDYHSLRGMLHGVFRHQVSRTLEDPAALRIRLELISLGDNDPELAGVIERVEAGRREWRRRLVQRAADHALVPSGWTVDEVTDLLSLAAMGLGIQVAYRIPSAQSHDDLVELVTEAMLAALQGRSSRGEQVGRQFALRRDEAVDLTRR